MTDIECITRLWEHYPEAMRLALKRHDMRIEKLVGEYNGNVFLAILYRAPSWRAVSSFWRLGSLKLLTRVVELEPFVGIATDVRLSPQRPTIAAGFD